MIGLRQFTGSDAEEIRQHMYPDMTIGEIEQMIAEWNTCVFAGRFFELLAVTKDGRIVGSASLKECSKSAVSLGIGIVAAERGKGIASDAMRLLLERAKEKGYRVALDQVRTDNAASIRLHEKFGFETDGYVYRNKRDHEVILYLNVL